MKCRVWLKTFLSLALLVYLIVRYGLTIPLPGQSGQLLWLLPPLAITLLIIPLMAGVRWQVFLRALGIRLPFKTILSINFRSIFWGMLLPSSDGFALIRCILVEKRVEARAGTATASVVAEKVVGMLCLGLVALLGSFFIDNSSLSLMLRLFIVLYLLIIVAFLVWSRMYHGDPGTASGKIRKTICSIRAKLKQSLSLTLALKALPWVLGVQFATIITTYFLFRYMGFAVPLKVHLCYLPVIQVLSLLPVSISGFGVREGAFVFFYKAVCANPPALITISVMSFVILTFVPAVIGGLLSLLERENLSHAA
jgi:uncharacterized protein (TIRG00374 family)